MVAGATCGTCVFFARHPTNTSRGQCRAHAPISARINDHDAHISTVWPMVSDWWWCGDHATAAQEVI